MKKLALSILLLINSVAFSQICPTIDSIVVPTSSAIIDMETVGTDVWLLTDDTLLKYDGTNWTYFDASTNNFPTDTLIDITSDNNGNVWLMSSDTISKYDGTNFTNIALPDSLHMLPLDQYGPVNINERFVADTLGNVWFISKHVQNGGPVTCGTFKGYLVEYDGANFIYHKGLGYGCSGISFPVYINLSFDKANNKLHYSVLEYAATPYSYIFDHNSGSLGINGYFNYSYSNNDPSIGYDFYSTWISGTDTIVGCSDLKAKYIIPITGSCTFYLGYTSGDTISIVENNEVVFNRSFGQNIVQMKDDVNGVAYAALEYLLIKFGPGVSPPNLIISSSTICTGDSVLASSSSPVDSILWVDFSLNGDLYLNTEGTFLANVYHGGGCWHADSVTLDVLYPFSNESICLVTVDSLTGYNKIVFEKTPNVRTEQFKIHKETIQAGVYDVVSTEPYGSLSEFIDTSSSPASVSARYKISVIDSCGNESALSAEHKTVHLASNIGLGGEVNLSWNAYDGFIYPTFDIYRGSSPSTMTLLTQVQSNLFSFSDQTPPNGVLYYQVIVTSPGTCVSGKQAGTYNSSLSNRITVNDVSSILDDRVDERIYLYPNPTPSTISIYNLKLRSNILVYNSIGQEVYQHIASNTFLSIDLKQKGPDGLYFIKVMDGQTTNSFKVILSK